MRRPAAGAVLGIDVGFSARAPSTGLCLLVWDDELVRLSVRRTRSDREARRRALIDLLESTTLSLTVALDGPLARELALVTKYRTAEALLSCGVFQKRGKPGQTNSPTGQRLHEHATLLARLLLELETEGWCRLGAACHIEPIHEKAIVEAFPNQFLAALLPESALPRLRRDASDRYWEACIASDRFRILLACLLPGRAFERPLGFYTGHDDRAAVVCALTALAVAVGEAIGVGDPANGDIMLPPASCWGVARDSEVPWMETALQSSLAAVRVRHSCGATARLTRSVDRRLSVTETT